MVHDIPFIGSLLLIAAIIASAGYIIPYLIETSENHIPLFMSTSAQSGGDNNTSPATLDGSGSGSGSNATSSPIDCSIIPSKIGAKAVSLPNPNRDVCDIVILRDSPQIKGHNGTILNKFLAINSLLEITPTPPNMTGTINTTLQSPENPKVMAMGEFALLQTELKPVLKAIARSDWNITAIHNHPILEEPDMIFVHWDALGDLNSIINQTKGALMQTSIMAEEGDSSSQGQQQQQQQDRNNETQQGPLEQLGEAIFGGGG
jgi:hypothetical protein